MNEQIQNQPQESNENYDGLIQLVNDYIDQISKPNYDVDLTNYIQNLNQNQGSNETQESQKEQTERKYAGIFNTIEDLEKSYKELQAEYTRVNQNYKKFERYKDLIELLDKDPVIQKKVAELIYKRYYDTGDRKEYSYAEEEDEFGFSDLYEENKNEKKFDISNVIPYIENKVRELVDAKIKEFFGLVNAIQNFAKKNNLDQDSLQEVINIAKSKNITLEEALNEYRDKMNKLREKIMKEIGATPVGKETPVFTSKNISIPQKETIDFSQGFDKLPREKQLELLATYFPFL